MEKELINALENLVENIQGDKDWWPDNLRKAVKQAEAVIEKAEAKTTLHMGGGMHAHITWNGDNGIDQHGREWINKSEPQLKRCAVAAVFNNALQSALETIMGK